MGICQLFCWFFLVEIYVLEAKNVVERDISIRALFCTYTHTCCYVIVISKALPNLNIYAYINKGGEKESAAHHKKQTKIIKLSI